MQPYCYREKLNSFLGSFAVEEKINPGLGYESATAAFEDHPGLAKQ